MIKGILAGPPPKLPPPRNKALLLRVYEAHWFPLIRPAINPLIISVTELDVELAATSRHVLSMVKF